MNHCPVAAREEVVVQFPLPAGGSDGCEERGDGEHQAASHPGLAQLAATQRALPRAQPSTTSFLV